MKQDRERINQIFQELTGIPEKTCQEFFQEHTVEEALINPLLLDIPAAKRKKVSALAELRALLPASNLLNERQQISGPEDACKYIRERMRNLDHEEVHVLFMDVRHRVIAYETLSQGSLSNTGISAHKLARSCLKHNASAVIIGHNHPSGDPHPSPDDIAATKSLKEALSLIEVQMVDHVVVGKGGQSKIGR